MLLCVLWHVICWIHGRWWWWLALQVVGFSLSNITISVYIFYDPNRENVKSNWSSGGLIKSFILYPASSHELWLLSLSLSVVVQPLSPKYQVLGPDQAHSIGLFQFVAPAQKPKILSSPNVCTCSWYPPNHEDCYCSHDIESKPYS